MGRQKKFMSDSERAKNLRQAIIYIENNQDYNPLIIKEYKRQLLELEQVIEQDRQHAQAMQQAVRQGARTQND